MSHCIVLTKVLHKNLQCSHLCSINEVERIKVDTWTTVRSPPTQRSFSSVAPANRKERLVFSRSPCTSPMATILRAAGSTSGGSSYPTAIPAISSDALDKCTFFCRFSCWHFDNRATEEALHVKQYNTSEVQQHLQPCLLGTLPSWKKDKPRQQREKVIIANLTFTVVLDPSFPEMERLVWP